MGTDIHMIVERRVGGGWERVSEVPSWPCPWCNGKGALFVHDPCFWCGGEGTTTKPYDVRDYSVFGALAGVRSRSGGIAPPRGLPKDMTPLKEMEWLGDHDASWLLLSELKAYDWDSIRRGYGYRPKFLDFISALEKIGAPDDVRIVFGFDS